MIRLYGLCQRFPNCLRKLISAGSVFQAAVYSGEHIRYFFGALSFNQAADGFQIPIASPDESDIMKAFFFINIKKNV